LKHHSAFFSSANSQLSNHDLSDTHAEFLAIPRDVCFKKMRTVLVVLALIIHMAVIAQSKGLLQPDAMRQDFNYLRHYLEAAHPGLYKHHTREAMQYKMDSLAATLAKPLPFLEFYKKIAYLIAEVRCEHTYCGYGPGYDKLVQSAAFFPIQLYFSDNKTHVLVNGTTDTTVHPGDELVSINQYPVDSIRQVLYQYIPADGYMTGSKDAELSSMAFSIRYYLFVEQAKEFQIGLRTKQGGLISKTCKAVTLKDINKQALANPVNKPILQLDARLREWRKEPLHLELMPEKNAAVLTVQSFSVDKDRFRSRIDSFFTLLSKNKVQKLIIDLSDNGGGDVELAADLLNYFIKERTSVVEYSYLITDADSILKLSDIPASVLKSKYNYIEPLKDGRAYAKLSELAGELKPLQPRVDRFAGKVYLFVNGGTSSAASTFSAVMKSLGLATVVGQETAGGYEGGGTTNGLDLTLPNSRITAHLSIVWQRFRTQGGDRDRGVVPDIKLVRTFEELVSGSKAWRESILEMDQAIKN
jgi:hypothetical protein